MNKVKITKREIVIFSIVSIIFLLIPFIAAPNFSSDQSIFKTGFFKRMLFENILLLVFFLVNYFVLIPKLYFQKRYFFYIIILIIFFIFANFFRTTGNMGVQPGGPTMMFLFFLARDNCLL